MMSLGGGGPRLSLSSTGEVLYTLETPRPTPSGATIPARAIASLSVVKTFWLVLAELGLLKPIKCPLQVWLYAVSDGAIFQSILMPRHIDTLCNPVIAIFSASIRFRRSLAQVAAIARISRHFSGE